MRRYLLVIFVLFTITSCGRLKSPFTKPIATVPTIAPTANTTFTAIPATSTPTSTPTLTATALPFSPTPADIFTPIPQRQDFTVHYHPDDVLYVGDQVSVEVISPSGLEIKDARLQVQVDPPNGKTLGQANFAAWGIQGRDEASLLWGWDTRDETPGAHTLSFSIQPQGYSWTEQVSLLPASDMPAYQAGAHWAETSTPCCTVFYITNTASERDLNAITNDINTQAQDAIQKMGASFTEPITVTVLPRLLGHGGFTSTEISVSYLDRNYAANSWAMVVHHEMIHAIDGHLGGEFRPTIFVEGLAVYMTGGHYKPEPLMPRAAALLDGSLNLYIPLKQLSDDFYASQHEIGYLEGASLIEYMVNTYGWDAFSKFYRDIHNKQGEKQSDAIDTALKAHFSLSFDQLEQAFLAALKTHPHAQAWVDDVRMTVTYYDLMRRYQQMLDPSAYFRTAWLLDNKQMREKGIVADYLRHPSTPVNLALETLFITANQQMTDKKYSDATHTLQGISSVLDAIEHGTTDPFSVSPLASNYLSISSSLKQQGYEVQRINLTGDTAQVSITTPAGPQITQLNLTRLGGEWKLAP